MAAAKPRHIRVRQDYPSLIRHGVAVRRIDRYVHFKPEQHSVDVVLLSVILRGQGRHLMGDEVYDEAGGTVAVTHYDQKHDIITDADGMDIYNVYLDLRNHSLPLLPHSLRSIASTILPIHPKLVHSLNRRVWFRIRKGEQLAASLARIEEEMNSTQPGAAEILQHSFQIFLIDLCREALENGLSMFGSAGRQFPAWLERLRQGIDRDFAESFPLGTLAAGAGVSVAYLCRLFKAYTGKTVVEYLVERRLQAAAWKLRESDEKVLTIALSCGFNDLAYFNRTFKRIFGMTPGDYRRQIQAT